ncbi:HD-GYP domain-containing protein [Marichromatium bheemlicum]|uniref:HD domain-containing protein n=1 Tax=Marichromatium bheemlicum TaxID=365339 RepID=A0ABX1IB58_9GAMM|nr:HD domain-containing phosphohydrolase [Marichromatium bheemlicum]NKN34289.1 HD domain-containing protein [Marichromatium bheemlicum]
MRVDESVYIRRLAELGESHEVAASADIRAANGAKLLRRGARIDRAVLERLLRQKLLEPIDHTTRVAERIERTTLIEDAQRLLERDQPLRVLVTALGGAHHDPTQIPAQLDLPGVLGNKLGVARPLYPELFEHSVATLLTAVALATACGFEPRDQARLALAALCHDIGILHLEAAALAPSQPLRPEHWSQFYAHPRIGALILEGEPHTRGRVARAVLEHHERLDGSGYPHGRGHNALSRLGTLLAFTEFVVSTTQRLGMHDMLTIAKTQGTGFGRALIGRLIAAMREQIGQLPLPPPQFEAEHLLEALDALWAVLDPPPGAPGLVVAKLAEIRLMLVRAGLAPGAMGSDLELLGDDHRVRLEQEQLLREALFRLRRLRLETLRRAGARSAPLETWVRHSGEVLIAVRQALQGVAPPALAG